MEFFGAEGSYVAVSNNRREFSAAAAIVRGMGAMAYEEFILREHVHEDILDTLRAMDILLDDSPPSDGESQTGENTTIYRVADAFGGVVRASIEAFRSDPSAFAPFMPQEAIADAQQFFPPAQVS